MSERERERGNILYCHALSEEKLILMYCKWLVPPSPFTRMVAAAPLQRKWKGKLGLAVLLIFSGVWLLSVIPYHFKVNGHSHGAQ